MTAITSGPGFQARLGLGYALLTFVTLPDTEAQARDLQQHLTAFLAKNKVRRVIWDMHRAPPNKEEGRAAMWRWMAESTLVRVSAFVVDSTLLRASTNMRALSAMMLMRSFADVAQAAEWIVQQPVQE